MISQKIIIIILVIILSIVFVWFILIDNYLIPIIQQQITTSYQNGYNTGVENSVTELFHQTSNCQTTYIWAGNDTRQLMDVACI